MSQAIVGFEEGQILVAQALTAGDSSCISRSMCVISVECFQNDKSLFYAFAEGNRKLIDEAILKMAKDIRDNLSVPASGKPESGIENKKRR